MDIYETIVNSKEKLISVYDLAAISYDYLLQRIENPIARIRIR